MTTKKAAKSRTASSGKATSAKPKAGGLLGRLKGALQKKPAAKSSATAAATKSTKKPAGKKPAAKTKPSAGPAVKKSPTAKAKAVQKSAPKTPARPAGGKPSGAVASKPTTSKSVSKPSAVATTPVARSHVTKSSTKKARTASFDFNLTEDDLKRMHDDDYMNDAQLEFFRRRLLQMRQEVLQREMDVKERLHEREVFADPADRATAEEEHWLDLRLRERESLLLRKIDDALRRIEAKEYGYCEKTGDPIGIPRLLARPTATVCVDVKGQDERVEAQYRDR